ncbi:MAG: cobalamin biosynthesis protein CobW, partial [Lachnospiraceae bacterium]|nr:cobalamin biosynthesis protein CobW [Lachnospiraceae bacterium]
DDIDGSQIVAAMEKEKSLVEELMEEARVCPTCGHVHEHGEYHHHEHHHEEHDHEGHGHEEHHHEHHHEEHDHEGHHHEEHGHEEHCHDHHHEEHDHEGHHHDDECGCGHHHHDGECGHHHHADDVFTSWGRETPHQYGKAEMEEILQKLADSEHPEYGIILRAKGMVPCSDGGWIYFDLTPEEYEVREGQPDVTGKLCVIGSELKEDKIAELFHV